MTAITNTNDLRRFLLDQMVAVSENKLDSAQVGSICALVDSVVQVTAVELQAAELIATHGERIHPLLLTDGSA